MYRDYFGFSEQPFSLTPNPEFLFLSSHHQEAFAHLLYGIDTRAGFIELSGEVGTGKTTVIRTLLNQLDPDTHRTALVFNPSISPLGLLQEINREFGLSCGSSETRDLLEALNGFLLSENSAGHAVILVIDEAQNLAPEVLEQIRLISNLETERAKLIQIVLVGQPELKALLARQELRQLDQRITVRYHLEPMGFGDTRDYIRHRIRIAAGGREPVAFSTGAVKRIFNFSKGLPRLINAACDRALLLAYTTESREISSAMASRSIADLRKEGGRGVAIRRYAAAALVVALLALGAALWHSNAAAPNHVAEQRAETALSREAALAALLASPEAETDLAALNAVLREWQSPPAAFAAGKPVDLRAMARERGFSLAEVTGKLDALARFDLPAFLWIELPGDRGRFIALTGLDKGKVAVTPAIAGRSVLTDAELAAIWSGKAFVPWKNFHDISTRLKPGSGDGNVDKLQELLKTAGFFAGDVYGSFDSRTEDAIRAFQRSEGITADGRPGEKTLLLLYRRGGGFFPPGLSRSGSNGEAKTTTEPGRVPGAERNG